MTDRLRIAFGSPRPRVVTRASESAESGGIEIR